MILVATVAVAALSPGLGFRITDLSQGLGMVAARSTDLGMVVGYPSAMRIVPTDTGMGKGTPSPQERRRLGKDMVTGASTRAVVNMDLVAVAMAVAITDLVVVVAITDLAVVVAMAVAITNLVVVAAMAVAVTDLVVVAMVVAITDLVVVTSTRPMSPDMGRIRSQLIRGLSLVEMRRGLGGITGPSMDEMRRALRGIISPSTAVTRRRVGGIIGQAGTILTKVKDMVALAM